MQQVVKENSGIGDKQVLRRSRTFMAVALGLVQKFKNDAVKMLSMLVALCLGSDSIGRELYSVF